MTMLEEIYSNKEILMGCKGDSEEAKKAYKELKMFLKNKGMNELDYENYINLLLFENGKQGFIEGFQMAVALFTNGGGALA